ncbi:NeuD/PglB/VioB family sugar acetyltransferase [Candidatus Bipolaricaulota bacterium]|nr:NeuD/PglB/VioB family sugar acetyltransferase [Candidatus Bipolaricaulota bacterium]
MSKIAVIGAGPYVKNIEEIVRALNEHRNEKLEIIGFIDSDETKAHEEFWGYKVLGGIEVLGDIAGPVGLISVISAGGRRRMFEKAKNYDVTFPNLIHPSAEVSPQAKLGKGNVIAQRTIIAPKVKVGDFNKINYSVAIGHHCRVGDYNTLNGLSHLTGMSTITNGCFVGPGAVIFNEVTIHPNVTVGANAVVRNDIPEGTTAVGVPARILPK